MLYETVQKDRVVALMILICLDQATQKNDKIKPITKYSVFLGINGSVELHRCFKKLPRGKT